MQWILTRVKTFIIKTVIDDIENNGPLRQIIGEDAARSLQRQRAEALLKDSAVFGSTPAQTAMPGPVTPGNAFKAET